MKEEIDMEKIWKLPEDLKEKVVKGKTKHNRKKGEISFWIAVALNRLDTHNEMRAIAKQIHPSTEYREFTEAIRAYLASSDEVRKKVCEGRIDILDLLKENPTELSKEDRKNLNRHKKAKELQNHLILFYKDLKFFLEGTSEDRDYLKKFLKPEKIHYLASLLTCIRKEDLLKTFLKNQGVISWEDL